MAGTIVCNTINTDTGLFSTNNAYNGVAKAWVNFVGSSATINNSLNVSSVTRNGTGDYTINYTTSMPSVNYVVTGCCQYVNTGGQSNQNIILNINDGSGNIATSSVRVSTKASTTPYDCATVMVGILSA